LSILLIFVLAGVASVSVTRRTVGRIESINATSRAIMQSGLGQRILLRGTRDEWDELAANLNSMLDRIEALMGEVKQVTDNVAHDLRTPLARMRGRLEKAYNMRRNGDYDQLLIGDTMADLEGVLRMFSSLTRISQIEAYDGTAAFRPVNLVEIESEGRGAIRSEPGLTRFDPANLRLICGAAHADARVRRAQGGLVGRQPYRETLQSEKLAQAG
jgi:signal transduction histidine kinase